MNQKSLSKKKTNKTDWGLLRLKVSEALQDYACSYSNKIDRVIDICIKELESNRSDEITAEELKIDWEKKKHDDIIGVWSEHDSLAIHDITTSEAECYNAGYKDALEQVEKEVEFVRVELVDEYDDYGKGWHDACLEYELKLMKLNKKLSAIRKEVLK